MSLRPLLFPPALIILIFWSCKKESFITSPDARISVTDSIKFDTVFTTTGSVTKSFKIINENDQKINFSTIKLAGGNSSPFSININGVAAKERNNIDVAANDSIYVFVSIRVNPATSNLPFIVSDSILISYNGVNRYVQLEAYGQNAVFLRSTVLTGANSWSNALPYVVLGSLRIDTNAVLTVPQGTRIYLHANAPILVDGTLILNGTVSEKIIFRGDRLDEPYRNFPASWPGIYIRNSSKNNSFTFAEIRNANQAVVVTGPSVNTNPKLIMNQIVIDNAFDAGLLCINSNVSVNNSLISNCRNNIIIQAGGNYNLTHCTVAAYSTTYIIHTKPALSIADAGIINGIQSLNALSAVFKNCIFWGENNSVNQEVVVNKQGNLMFSVLMDRCLYKSDVDPANTQLQSVIKNIDPLFDTIDYANQFFNFRINNPLAPGINKGATTSLTKDLNNNPRSVGLPDLGSYEKQ